MMPRRRACDNSGYALLVLACLGKDTVRAVDTLYPALALPEDAQLTHSAIRIDLAILGRLSRLAESEVALLTWRAVHVEAALYRWNREACSRVARLARRAIGITGTSAGILALEVHALRGLRTVSGSLAEGADQASAGDTREGVVAIGV